MWKTNNPVGFSFAEKYCGCWCPNQTQHIPLLPFLGNISNIFPCQPWLDSIMLFVTVIHSRTQCTEVNGILVGCPISWFHFKLTVRLHGWISFDAYKYLRTCNYDTTLHFQANGYICVQIHTPTGLRLRLCLSWFDPYQFLAVLGHWFSMHAPSRRGWDVYISYVGPKSPHLMV